PGSDAKPQHTGLSRDCCTLAHRHRKSRSQQVLSWRIGEHLAMRRFVFLERFFNTPRVPIQDGKHAVFFEPDLSDFSEKLRWYLTHDAVREQIAAAGGDYFAMYCAPDRQVAGMLETL